MALEGRQLGRFRIVRLLGSGGMGEVYLAEDPRIKQQAAIKVIRAEAGPYPNAPGGQTAARLFEREARAIVALDHPRILPLNDYGEEPQGKTSLIYLVMPYRPEGSLVDWVQQRYPDRVTPPEVVAHLVSQAAEAIQHAHDHQIIHMDVKPSNFLIRTNPKTPDRPDLLLADFGIARIASATAITSQAIRGTPAYMAPEQCEGEAVPASDQYALAVMAYELLAGRPPFQGNSMRIMFQHVNTPPEPPSAYNTHLSKALDEALLTALAKRPAERFKSVIAFAAAFANAVQAMGIADASTLISGAPASPITNATPDTPLISATLADAVTKISAPDAEAALAADMGSAEASSVPAAQGWAAASTEPTAVPLPETVDLGQSKGSDPVVPSAPQGWTEATDAPTAPPLPDTLTFGPEGTGDSAEEREEAKPAGAAFGPAPILPAPMPPGSHRRAGKRRFLLIAAAALVMLALVAGGTAYAFPGFLPSLTRPSAGASSPSPAAPASATVTITPASKDLQKTYSLSAVTGAPDTSRHQVRARLISATTPTYTSTVNATGQKYLAATYATGIINIWPGYSTEVWNKGTIFYGKLTSGASLDLILTVDVGAINAPVNVAAVAAQAGASGNFPSTWPNWNWTASSCSGSPPCADSSFTAQSTGPFTGGQDARTVSIVQQSDINNAANSLISADQPYPQQMMQGQVKSNEQLIGTPQCASHVSSNHRAGVQASTVTVGVWFTCTGEVYDHDGALTLGATLLTNDAIGELGSGYALVGNINTAIVSVSLGSNNTVAITVSADGVWTYQFSNTQKQALAQLIAGKSVQAAQQILDSQPGVAKATIQLSGGQTLPSDPTKITIVVQAAGT